MIAIDIVKLPTAEKLRPTELPLNSIYIAPSDEIKSTNWHTEVPTERVRRLVAGNEAVSSWSEAKERIRRQASTQPMQIGITDSASRQVTDHYPTVPPAPTFSGRRAPRRRLESVVEPKLHDFQRIVRDAIHHAMFVCNPPRPKAR